MKRLKTDAIARMLHLPPETVRQMVRTGAVSWGCYIKPKTPRYGHGTLIYYPEAFAAATGISMEEVQGAMA